MSDFEDDEHDELQLEFDSAADYLQKVHSELSSADLLQFYGLYKQATCGSCNTPKPGMFNMQAKSKWNAWNDLQNMDKLTAMDKYVGKLSALHPDWNKGSSRKKQWVCQSMPQVEPEKEIHESDKTAFDHIKEKDLAKLQKALPRDLAVVDDLGMGLVHWAADRNATDILEFLLSSGADVNMRDADGQTALHYASSCGHAESIQILLKHKADCGILDNDGSSCSDMAFDEHIASLLTS